MWLSQWLHYKQVRHFDLLLMPDDLWEVHIWGLLDVVKLELHICVQLIGVVQPEFVGSGKVIETYQAMLCFLKPIVFMHTHVNEAKVPSFQARHLFIVDPLGSLPNYLVYFKDAWFAIRTWQFSYLCRQ